MYLILPKTNRTSPPGLVKRTCVFLPLPQSHLKLVLERLKQRGCDWGARTGPSGGAKVRPHLWSGAEVRGLRGKSGTER